MVERGGRPLTAGEEADRIEEERGGEAGEAETGSVAEAPMTPAATTVALEEDAPDEVGEGIEHNEPCDRRLWQLLESPGRQLEQGLSLLTQAHRIHFAPLLHWQQRCEAAEALMVCVCIAYNSPAVT